MWIIVIDFWKIKMNKTCMIPIQYSWNLKSSRRDKQAKRKIFV